MYIPTQRYQSLHYPNIVTVKEETRYYIVNPFPHTSYQQQTTLKVCSQTHENSINEGTITEKKKLGNGGIARFEQFLLLPICFQKTSIAEAPESVYIYIWERVKIF